jgi:hypothetical protein
MKEKLASRGNAAFKGEKMKNKAKKQTMAHIGQEPWNLHL